MKRFFISLLAVAGLLLALGCGDNGDSIVIGGNSKSPAAISVEKARPGGSYTISMNGGEGLSSSGGTGGHLNANCYGTGGIVFASGVKDVDTNFNIPTSEPAPVYGTEKLTVSSNLTLDVYLDTATGNASTLVGDYYLALSTNSIYKNSTPSADVVTGLEVRPGVTLTLGLNQSYGGGAGQDACYLVFSDDVVINGTLVTKDLTTGTVGGATVDDRHSATATSRDKGYLQIDCETFFMGNGSLIDTEGDDATAANTRGGDGGGVNIQVRNAAYLHGGIHASGGDGLGTGDGGVGATQGDSPDGIFITTNDGVIISTGTNTLDAHGGSGSNGAYAGTVQLAANSFLYNKSPILAYGGNGSNGTGGFGAPVVLITLRNSLYNSGDIQNNGGNAASGRGGDSGTIIFHASSSGTEMAELFNSGDIETSGGNSVAADGGNCQTINFILTGSGDLRNSGSIAANGGNSTGASYIGGMGAPLFIILEKGYDNFRSNYSNKGDLLWTNNISLNGGNGDSGGLGGWLEINNTSYNSPFDAADYGIYFVGYNSLSADGGSGDNGGMAEFVYLFTQSATGTGGMAYNECGPVIFMADCHLSGGNATGGTGGFGGNFDAQTLGQGCMGNTACIFNGDLYVNGGDGPVSGGNGQRVYIYGYDYTEFNGDIYSHGGDGTGTNGNGGLAAVNGVMLSSTYNTYVSGNLYGWGGSANGVGLGGHAYFGTVQIRAGAQVTCNMDFDLHGGDADATNGTGGDGGWLDIASQWIGTNWNGTTWDITGGTGLTPGNIGYARIDWTLYEGQLP